jgi:hypothetical protein
MQTWPDQSGLILVNLRVILHPARSTDIERFANMTIREEVDQVDSGNDHTEQNRPGVERANQLDGTEDEIQDLEDDHCLESPAPEGSLAIAESLSQHRYNQLVGHHRYITTFNSLLAKLLKCIMAEVLYRCL